MKQKCARDTDQEQYEYLLDLGYDCLYSGRWGSIIEVYNQLLRVEVVLRKSWSLDTYLKGSNRQAERGQVEDDDVLNESDKHRLCLEKVCILLPTFSLTHSHTFDH